MVMVEKSPPLSGVWGGISYSKKKQLLKKIQTPGRITQKNHQLILYIIKYLT